MQLRRVAAEIARIVRPAALEIAERVGVRTDAAAEVEGRRIPATVRARARSRAKALAEKAAPEAGKRLERHSKSEFVRLGIKLSEAEPTLGPLIAKFRRENVELITSLADREIDTLQRILAGSDGRRVENIAKDIEERFRVTASKAELLARDQTLKLNAAITQARHARAGITEYIWTTVGDERVRETHAALDGQTFSYDDPPVTNDAGDRNHPGEDYQCRCSAYPVLPELEEIESTAE
jgi:SPP1 gp7 family putative phage head morphogenesis protein